MNIVIASLLVVCGLLLPNGVHSATRRRSTSAEDCVWFYDDFSKGIQSDVWTMSSTAWGGGNEEFQAFIPDEQVMWHESGGLQSGLHIKPELWNKLRDPSTGELYGNSFYETGTLDFTKTYGYCTKGDSIDWGCFRNNGNVPPVGSGQVISKISFKYGSLEIDAKLPSGDWMWPALWLLPKGDLNRSLTVYEGELDITESRGNNDLFLKNTNINIGNKLFSSAMHFCKNYTRGFQNTNNKYATESWTKGFHKYGLEWTPTSVRFLVDGDEVLGYDMEKDGRLTDHCTDVPPYTDEDCLGPFCNKEILIHVAVGGVHAGYFPDDTIPMKPWQHYTKTYSTATNAFYDALSQWYPSWEADGEMVVRHVKLSAKPGQDIILNGETKSCGA